MKFLHIWNSRRICCIFMLELVAIASCLKVLSFAENPEMRFVKYLSFFTFPKEYSIFWRVICLLRWDLSSCKEHLRLQGVKRLWGWFLLFLVLEYSFRRRGFIFCRMSWRQWFDWFWCWLWFWSSLFWTQTLSLG